MKKIWLGGKFGAFHPDLEQKLHFKIQFPTERKCPHPKGLEIGATFLCRAVLVRMVVCPGGALCWGGCWEHHRERRWDLN